MNFGELQQINSGGQINEFIDQNPFAVLKREKPFNPNAATDYDFRTQQVVRWYSWLP